MTDLQATLDAIDEVAVHECGYCSEPLPMDGESLDFCDPRCQQAWTERHNEVVDLVGYREPHDLPEHVYNLFEGESPETTPEWPRYGLFQAGRIEFNLQIDTSQLEAAMDRAAEGLRRFSERMDEVRASFAGVSARWWIVDECRDWQPVGLGPLEALKLSSPVIDLPDEPPEGEPFGSDFPFEQTPAKTLPSEPPPAVMVPLERDWQALFDAPRVGPTRPVRAPRHLGRTR